MASESKLQTLPVELIARVFSYLDFNDLVAVSRLNRFLRDVYQSFPELQYSFMLQVAGMVDGDPSLDIHSKVAELNRREIAWRTLDLSRVVTVKVPHRTSHIYDLSGGVYLLGDCRNNTVTRETKSLRVFDLSTCASGSATRTESWRELTVDADIVDVAFCLHEFDLIAVVGIKKGQVGEKNTIIVYLRELSTGRPHPLARNAEIVVGEASSNWGKMSIMMEIVGPRLLLLMTWRSIQRREDARVRDILVLANWWEGRAVVAERAEPTTWDGFVFLTPELVLLPNHARGVLEIIRLPDVVNMQALAAGVHGYTRVLALALPALQPSCSISAIACRAEPNPFGAPHPDAPRETRRRLGPCAPDPAQALVLLQLYIREFTNAHDFLLGQWGVLRHNLSLVVHRAALLALVREAERGGDVEWGGEGDGEDVESGDEPPVVPWKVWGAHTRWLADDTHVSNWITTTAGQRYVGMSDSGRIVVKDFNPTSVQRARAAGASSYFPSFPSPRSDEGVDDGWDTDSERVDVDEDTDVNMESTKNTEHAESNADASWRSVRLVECFSAEEEIELRRLFSAEFAPPLPCVEYASVWEYNHHGLLMDEERIIGLRHDENTGAIVEFDVFTL